MIYNSWLFFLFVLVTLFVYWRLCPGRFRPWLLLASGLGLFLYLLPAQALLIFALATVVYLAGEVIAGNGRRGGLALVLGVAGLLVVLGYFKYAGLLAETLGRLAGAPGWQAGLKLPGYAVPLGISFFTFRFIHYLVDIARGRITERGYFRFLVYTFFFPIMPSGPIERYRPVVEQAFAVKKFDPEYVTAGASRIMWGLFKKIVLADGVAFMAAKLSAGDAGAAAYWAAMYAYTWKIYWDFSGYSDMAVGTARLFGIRVVENFNNPYLQTNISRFWKCWHMSLTGWFRDYLFIPLGGSRGGFGLTVRNTLVVMAATGIWHGAAWHFMFWGLYHAMGLIALRLYNMSIGRLLPGRVKQSRGAALISWVLTFHFAGIGWIFFAVDVRQGLHVLKVMFGL